MACGIKDFLQLLAKVCARKVEIPTCLCSFIRYYIQFTTLIDRFVANYTIKKRHRFRCLFFIYILVALNFFSRHPTTLLM